MRMTRPLSGRAMTVRDRAQEIMSANVRPRPNRRKHLSYQLQTECVDVYTQRIGLSVLNTPHGRCPHTRHRSVPMRSGLQVPIDDPVVTDTGVGVFAALGHQVGTPGTGRNTSTTTSTCADSNSSSANSAQMTTSGTRTVAGV